MSEIQHDTTYSKISGQDKPVYTELINTYNEEGYLIKRVRSAISIQLTNKVTTTYEYRDGRLSLENFGNRITEYRYNTDGSLKTTISTSLISGNKTVVDYEDDVPKALEKTADGYLYNQENEVTYLDKNLLLKRYEQYKEGQLVFEQDYDLQKEGLPQLFLPEFKGFPKIKAPAYRKGIEKHIVTYKTIDGNRILSDEKMLIPEFDKDGHMVKSSGFEHINQETNTPESRDLLFEYVYETY